MKKVLMFLGILVLLIVGAFVGFEFYNRIIDRRKPVLEPQIPQTTTIQILVPSSDGLGDTKVAFGYEISFEPLIEFFGEAFPVKILSTAAINTYPDGSSRMLNKDDYIGDRLGDFGVTLFIKQASEEASDDNVHLRFEIEGDRFIRKSSLDGLIPQGKVIEIFPRISYDYDALERLVQPASENVYFRLFYGSVPLIEKKEIVRFHSVNEIPFYVASRWDENSVEDYTDYFAAYVNEDDPLIDTILKEALQIGTAEKIGYGNGFSFSGYQRKDADGDSSLSVDLQVLAIWSVFLKHNIKYSNITTTSTASGKINTQYVRTLSESFGNAQANCVDGSVLFASVMRKIGIEPYLIILPGHMLVAYLRNEDFSYESLAFLETTMLGSVDISKYTKDDSIFGKIKNKTGFGKTQASVTRDSFLAALDAGEEAIDEAEADDITVIDITECRNFGIKPIVRH
jgi:hypothetical protein